MVLGGTIMTEKNVLVFEPNQMSKVLSPQDCLIHFKNIQRKQQECFAVILLDGANQVISTKVVTTGLINRTLVHPREIFREAVKKNAFAVIIGHNHPSGNNNPSAEDHDITKRLKSAGKIIGINVVDHVIISKTGYYSFLEDGKL